MLYFKWQIFPLKSYARRKKRRYVLFTKEDLGVAYPPLFKPKNTTLFSIKKTRQYLVQKLRYILCIKFNGQNKVSVAKKVVERIGDTAKNQDNLH